MNHSDFAVMAFVAALCTWAVQPHRPRIRRDWVFKAPGGSRKGVHIPAASPHEALDRFLKECV